MLDLIDIGINLTNKAYKKDLDQVIESAKAVGVNQMIITGTSEDNSTAALELANQHQLYATAGIHPHDAKDATEQSYATLEALHKEARVIAVGETGLDFNRDFSPRPVQEQVLQRQLELAVKSQLPLFMHQRDAHDRFYPILKDHRDGFSNAVVHCFTGNRKELFDYLDMDLYIGITGWVCDERRGKPLKDLVHNIPLSRLMIETDGPYLLPRDIKPKPKSNRNEPKYLPHIANTLAGCYDISTEEFAAQVTENTKCFFKLP